MIRRQHFEPEAVSVAAARHFVCRELRSLPPATQDLAGLIVSELATNAVVHTGTAFDVSLEREGATIEIAVTDHGDGSPEAKAPPPPDAFHGRGLLIVSKLADAWGVTAEAPGSGKTVWARLQGAADPVDAATPAA